MSSLLANEFAEASTALHRAALSEVALILLVMSLLFNVTARWLVVGGGRSSPRPHIDLIQSHSMNALRPHSPARQRTIRSTAVS